MRRTVMQTLTALVLVFGLALVSTTLIAQERVPISRPSSIWSHAPTVPSGPTPRIAPKSPTLAGTTILQSYDGVDFLGSNCDCLPPDNGTAVGGNYVVEVVNVQIRIFDKTTGAILLDEPLQTFFGQPSDGDPYMVYDELADRWFMNAFNSDASGLILAASKTNNPLGGWYIYNLNNVGGFPDFAKPGYNKDAIFVSLNDFGSNGGYIGVATIDKAAAYSGTLVYYFTYPPFLQFRAMPPARFHGDTTGGTEWFASIDQGGGNALRVTKMTNYLSNSPHYTTWLLPVNAYQQFVAADQPGGPGTVADNDPTTTEVQIHNKRLVTAAWASTARDGFLYPKGLYYQVDLHTATPIFMQEGLIDPGPGVGVYMVSADQDKNGNIGATWMESSNSEYVSMWVGTRPAIFPYGAINANQVAPGGGFMPYSFRTGDYSSTVLDSDGLTFWSANEYIGNDGNGNNTDIWLTHISSYHK